MRQTRRPLAVIVSILAALTLLVGAFALAPAGAASGLSPLELAQVQRANCQVLAAHATSSAQRSRANQCIADQTAIIAALSSSPTPTPSATQTPSPSPSPTVQPSPSVSPTATTPPATTPPATTPPPSPTPTGTLTNCVADPGRCGFPDALSTGPSGALAVSTRTQYATAGETIANVQINGCVEIRAANVTFRNVLFNAAGCFYAIRNWGAAALLEDIEVTCGGQPGSNGFTNADTNVGTATLRRADIHDCENGLNVPGDTALSDSWIHDLYDGGSAHTDGAQFNQGAANISFVHNVFDVRGNTSSAVTMWDEVDPQNRDVLFDRNFFIDGAYSLRCGRQGTAVNVVVTGNRFVPGTYGYANACDRGGVVWSGNVLDATGLPAAAA